MRNLGLDVLRFCAVVLVLGQHLNADYLPAASPIARSGLWVWQHGGGIGVTLFFVMSGFLISGLLFDECGRTGTVDVKRFLMRRGFKLYPPLWALTAFTVAVSVFFTGRLSPDILRRTLAEVFFVQNYFRGLFGYSWTLAVEEHFYIAFSALVGWLCSRGGSQPLRAIPLIWAATAVTTALLRLRAVQMSSAPQWTDFHASHLCVDALMFGVMLSYMCRVPDVNAVLTKVPASALAVLGGCCVSVGFTDQPPTMAGAMWAPVVNYLGCGSLLLAACRLESASMPGLRLLGFLGSTSYSTYLWHGWVNIGTPRILFRTFGDGSMCAYLPLYVAGSFAMGVVMHRLVEQPAMSLRDRLLRSRPASAVVRMPQPKSAT